MIDPMDSRDWIMGALRSVPDQERPDGKKRPNIDTCYVGGTLPSGAVRLRARLVLHSTTTT